MTDAEIAYWTPVDLDDERMRTGLQAMAARRRGDLDVGAVHVGWKVGWNDAGVRRMLDLRSGGVGYLTDLTSVADGRVEIADGSYAAEVEVAFAMAASIRSTDPDTVVLGAVAHLRPAIEIVAFARLDLVDALARDIWHHAFALGPPTPWTPDLIPALAVQLRHNGGDVAVPPPGTDKLADVAGMLRFVAGGAEALGQELGEGDVILSGSLASTVPWVAAGDRIDVHMDPLGDVSVSIVDGQPGTEAGTGLS